MFILLNVRRCWLAMPLVAGFLRCLLYNRETPRDKDFLRISVIFYKNHAIKYAKNQASVCRY